MNGRLTIPRHHCLDRSGCVSSHRSWQILGSLVWYASLRLALFLRGILPPLKPSIARPSVNSRQLSIVCMLGWAIGTTVRRRPSHGPTHVMSQTGPIPHCIKSHRMFYVT